MSQCKTCGSTLGPRNKSGYCRNHFNALEHCPEWRERQSRGIKTMLSDPVKLEAARDRARAAGKAPGATEARREAAKRIGLYRIGHAALEGNTDARRRAGAKRSSTALAHIPRERRDDYRELTRKKVSAAEAAAMVLEEHERDMGRFRRELMEARG